MSTPLDSPQSPTVSLPFHSTCVRRDHIPGGAFLVHRAPRDKEATTTEEFLNHLRDGKEYVAITLVSGDAVRLGAWDGFGRIAQGPERAPRPQTFHVWLGQRGTHTITDWPPHDTQRWESRLSLCCIALGRRLQRPPGPQPPCPAQTRAIRFALLLPKRWDLLARCCPLP